MEINPNFYFLLVLSLTFLTNSIVQIQCNKLSDTLGQFYKAQMKRNSGIDASLFQEINLVDASKFHSQYGLKEKDRIKRLPGQPPVEFAQFGGYVTVDKAAGRAFYYYFAEAHHSPQSLPLLLWLNGGPACSSLAYGAMEELGPFRVNSDGKTLYTNRYSWNYAANVLFLESPAGVGFSYSNTTSDYNNNGDRKTAEDNYVFLVNWLERFPEYKNRDFYISGESYAGHYVPQLAHTILYHNKKANKTIINLKGILIGNAEINDETDFRGIYDYLKTHAIISQDVWTKILKTCDLSLNATSQSDDCNSASDLVNKQIHYINIDNIYAPRCFHPTTTLEPIKPSLTKFDPCSDSYVHAYLNRADVQEAMHANVTKLTHDWESCSDIIHNWVDSPATVIPLLQEIMATGLRVWIFSGDIDARVPVTATLSSIDVMKLQIKTEWHPWYLKGEIGGYTQEYEGDLTFATVREAGHQVPSYQPLRALSLIMHFLSGTPLPDTTRYS